MQANDGGHIPPPGGQPGPTHLQEDGMQLTPSDWHPMAPHAFLATRSPEGLSHPSRGANFFGGGPGAV